MSLYGMIFLIIITHHSGALSLHYWWNKDTYVLAFNISFSHLTKLAVSKSNHHSNLEN